MRTHAVAAPSQHRTLLLLAAVSALVLVEAWPIPTIVGGFVLIGVWVLAAAEEWRLSSHQHYRPSVRVRRVQDLVALIAAVGAAAAATRWPEPLAAGSLLFLGAAIGLLLLAGQSRSRHRGPHAHRRPQSLTMAPAPLPPSRASR